MSANTAEELEHQLDALSDQLGKSRKANTQLRSEYNTAVVRTAILGSILGLLLGWLVF